MFSSRLVLRYIKRYVYLIPVFWFLFFLASFYIDNLHHSDRDTRLPIKQRNKVNSKTDIKAGFKQDFKAIPPGGKDISKDGNDNHGAIHDKKVKATTPHRNDKNGNAVNANVNPVKEPIVEGDELQGQQGNWFLWSFLRFCQ